MNTIKTILATERDFFAKVARAAFLNPFGESRDELDLVLAGTGVEDRDEVLAAIINRVAERVAVLQRELRGNLNRLPAPDRETVRTVLLFDLFHRFLNAFDRLIREQAAAGDTPCTVPFAGGFLAAFGEAGFTEAESRRYLALFY